MAGDLDDGQRRPVGRVDGHCWDRARGRAVHGHQQRDYREDGDACQTHTPPPPRFASCYLTVTTLVELLFVDTGSVVLDVTETDDVIVPLLPVMKKLTWKVITPPAGTVASAGTAGDLHVNVVPDGG